MFNAIVCCEESQAVTKELRKLGVNAFSNDIKRCTGGHPEWHIQGDAFEAIKKMDFLLMIAHPPCTHIAVSGSKHFNKKILDGRQQAGIELFMKFTDVYIPHTALENPVSIMSSLYRQPDQIIQPYFFGDKAQKTTCLWLKGLPPLYHAKETDLFNQEVTHVDKGKFITLSSGKKMAKWIANIPANSERGTERSKTFSGIASAMAKQWTEHLIYKYKL